MQRAIELAERGRGRTSPNPLVGAVIVKNDAIVGEGYHAGAGESHAEINAINHATEILDDATLYVTLEPCCSYGRTPPCTRAIISSKIKKVIVGLIDPNLKVCGKGIDELKKAQIEVEVGVDEKEITKQNEVYIKYISTKMPFVLTKSAISFDGKITSKDGRPMWITGKESREHVHLLRDRNDAIMVGIGTVIADDPMLTVRLGQKETKNPLRVIVDSNAKLSLDSKIVKTAGEVPTLLAVTENAPGKKTKALINKKVEVLVLPNESNGVNLKSLFTELGEREITSVILEGGARLISSALRENLVDKMIFFIAPKVIGGDSSLNFIDDKEISFDFNFEKCRLIGGDLLVEIYPKRTN